MEGKRKLLSACHALAEGIRRSRASSRVGSLLSRAARLDGDERKEAVCEAAESFAALDERRASGILSSVDKRLRHDSVRIFDHPERVREAIALSSFLSEISKQLPEDPDGNKMTGPFERVIDRLEILAGIDKHYDPSSPEHVEARLTCTKALWDLDYGDIRFWEARMADDATSGLAIRLLLEMPSTADPAAHGWTLLRAHLHDLGGSIASNTSPKLADFMIEMLLYGDMKTTRSVFDALSLADDAPPVFVHMARGMRKEGQGDDAPGRFLGKISKRERDGHSRTRADAAGSGTRHMRFSEADTDMQLYLTVLQCADDRQFSSALMLLMRYRMGRDALRIIIPEIAKEMLDIFEEPSGEGPRERLEQQAKASEVLRQIRFSGFTIMKR